MIIGWFNKLYNLVMISKQILNFKKICKKIDSIFVVINFF